jgi:hypothetical protein
MNCPQPNIKGVEREFAGWASRAYQRFSTALPSFFF